MEDKSICKVFSKKKVKKEIYEQLKRPLWLFNWKLAIFRNNKAITAFVVSSIIIGNRLYL